MTVHRWDLVEAMQRADARDHVECHVERDHSSLASMMAWSRTVERMRLVSELLRCAFAAPMLADPPACLIITVALSDRYDGANDTAR